MIDISFPEWLECLGWLKKGDCVYVVSDMLELGKTYKQHGEKLKLDDLIECLQKLVGNEGTIVFPAFNWDFCKGVAFDYYKTPVRTGSLPKAALSRDDFVRTDHPIYSFAIWGKHQREWIEIKSKNSFGTGTIFEKLFYENAKVLAIGLGALKGTTYIHHVEQMVGVPYRYNKDFSAEYKSQDGISKVRTYSMYVRDLEKNPQHINGFELLEKKMSKEGLIKTSYFENVPCHFMMISDLDAAVRNDILNNDSRNMYVYNK
jgi:aminoglycoside 3-N-acetyltransferase